MKNSKQNSKENPKFFYDCCSFLAKITARKSFITQQPKPKGKKNPRTWLSKITRDKEPIQVFNFQAENNPKIKKTQQIKSKNKEISMRKQRMLINQRREKRFIRFSWKPKSLCNNKPKRVKRKWVWKFIKLLI